MEPRTFFSKDASSTSGLRVICMSQDGRIERSWLPSIAVGRYQLYGLSDRVYVEANEGDWHACCEDPSSFVISPSTRSHRIQLTGNSLVSVIDDGRRFMLYTEAAEHEGDVFHNYLVSSDSTITIGRSNSCDIVCLSRFVSQQHALLRRAGNSWEMVDNNSANRVYVNGRSVTSAQLKLGDVVFVMGLVIVVGQGYLAINDERSDVSVNAFRLKKLDGTSSLIRMASPSHSVPSVYNRNPRHRFAFSPKSIEIESPPISLNSDRIPLVLRMGGAATMGGMSALSGNYMPLISSLLFPVLSQKYTDKQKREYEQRRQTKYDTYLKQKSVEIEAEAHRERDILARNYPDLATISHYPFDDKHLWERRNVDDDFLHVRLGTGRVPLRAELQYPKRRFELDEDELEERMFKLVEAPVFLEKAPIVVSLIKCFVSGIRGDERLVLALVHALMLQIAVLQSYDECKIVLIASRPLVDDVFSYAKTLPHLWDNQHSTRFIVTNNSEAYEIGRYLREQLGDDLRRPRSLDVIVKERPYYCVIALDKQLFECMEVLKEVMQLNESCGVSVITAFSDPPKDCMLLLDVSSGGRGKASYLREIDREDDAFALDVLDQAQLCGSMHRVANITIRHVDQAQELPKSLTFMDMMGIGKLEQLAPLRRWQQSDPTKSLAVPIGIAPDGTPAMLDLHERVHGPHGLVAGMTGSGKSEFLLTYLLSLAIHFHPDEVSFVLIDYKGGGLAGAFVDENKGIHLPHVVGTITNLDGPAIQRSLISLEAEVKRRQRVFNKAKSIANEGTMDIYAYQRLYRRGAVAEPVPHLIIVSDEFAELKQQQPEFMDQLVSIARIGRSLGVHLILATQKPAGVVNEQIWSNSKFKACLKVQSKQDSMDMLKRPEAAELKDVGRFYLQIGYNESFSVGQSGWSGAPYAPADEVQVREDQSVQFVDMVGQVVYEGRPQPKRVDTGKSQLVAIVEELCHVAGQAGVKPRMLWKEQLPVSLDLDTLVPFDMLAREGKESITVPLGMLDDPANQRQMPFVLPLQTLHNLMIAGEPGSGKTTFIQSLLLTLARIYGPDQVNFYVLDYSSRMLKLFSSLPHCGCVLGEEDVDELDSFFSLLRDIMVERRALFDQLNVDSFESARELMPIPLVVVAIDNIAGLSASKMGEKWAYNLPDYLRSGLGLGIRFVVTCNRTSDMSGRVRSELAGRVSLAQKDKYEYFDVLGKRVDYLPPIRAGRGLYAQYDRPLELQVARYASTLPESMRPKRLEQAIGALAEKWAKGAAARHLGQIPFDKPYDSLLTCTERGRIPLGYDCKSTLPVALPMRQLSGMSLYFGNPDGKKPVLLNLLSALRANDSHTIVVTASLDSIFRDEGELANLASELGVELIDCSVSSLTELWKRLSLLPQERYERLQSYCEQEGADPQTKVFSKRFIRKLYAETQPMIVVFESFRDICAALPQDSTDEDVRRAIAVFSRLIAPSKRYNNGFIACFDSNDPAQLYSHELFLAFNPDQLCLLYGGQTNKQSLCTVPSEYLHFNERGDIRMCLVQYRSEFHRVFMPCERLSPVDVDPDEQSMFLE